MGLDGGKIIRFKVSGGRGRWSDGSCNQSLLLQWFTGYFSCRDNVGKVSGYNYAYVKLGVRSLDHLYMVELEAGLSNTPFRSLVHGGARGWSF